MMATIDDLDQLTELVQSGGPIYLRYSLGPEADGDAPSRDYEADIDLPGLPCTLLNPESWWPRDPVDWIARRVCKYLDLSASDPRRRPWVLTGEVAGYGPDHEPLLCEVKPIAWLGDSLVAHAQELYRSRFQVGRTSV